MDVQTTRFPVKAVAVFAALSAALALSLVTGIGQAQAAEPGDDDFLGSAETFVIIAANTVTDAGPAMGTEVHGDVASTATNTASVQLVAGQVINGDIYVDGPTPDPTAEQALFDAKIAYGLVAAAIPTDDVGTANLALNSDHYVGGIYVYEPGVYNSATELLLAGDITLDGLGDANAVFIFQAGTETLTVETGSRVFLINGAQACNVYWQVGSSATIKTNAQFVGTILAATTITLQTNATVDGQLLSSNLNAGAVNLDDNLINGQTLCVRTTTTGTTATGTTTTGTVRVDGVTTPLPTITTPPIPTTTTTTTTTTVGNSTLASTGNRTLANTGTTQPTGTMTGVFAALAALGAGTLLVLVARRKTTTERTTT